MQWKKWYKLVKLHPDSRLLHHIPTCKNPFSLSMIPVSVPLSLWLIRGDSWMTLKAYLTRMVIQSHSWICCLALWLLAWNPQFICVLQSGLFDLLHDLKLIVISASIQLQMSAERFENCWANFEISTNSEATACAKFCCIYLFDKNRLKVSRKFMPWPIQIVTKSDIANTLQHDYTLTKAFYSYSGLRILNEILRAIIRGFNFFPMISLQMLCVLVIVTSSFAHF